MTHRNRPRKRTRLKKEEIAIPSRVNKWDQLPESVKKAMFSQATGTTERLKRKLA